MKVTKPTAATGPGGVIFAILLAALLAILFAKSFLPGYVHFSNDGPLGVQAAKWLRPPASFTGAWEDLNDIGLNAGSFPVDPDKIVHWLFGPVFYAKFLAPIALFILGLGAWCFLRQLQLSPLAATLGALAATLNSTFFSSACWGVATQQIGIGMDFFALALTTSNTPETPARLRWARLALAGLCVGVNVMEGADIGAIFSMLVAAVIFFRSLTMEAGPVLARLARGAVRVVVVAAFAGLIAVQTVVSLIGFAVTGAGGGGSDAETPAQHWDWATQWSLPKIETLGFFVPGLFGYRPDTPKDMMTFLQDDYRGGNYWGGMGRDPNFDRFLDKKFQAGDQVIISSPDNSSQNVALPVGPDGKINVPQLGPIAVAGMSGLKLKETIDQACAARGIKASVQMPPGSFMRFTGGVNYAGILVTLIAAWAVAQSFRRQNSVLAPAQQRMVWFWTALLVVCVLLAWGRFAPFYALIYKLPYFSTIRNPTKFILVFSWAIVILFAYGVHGLSRRCLEIPAPNLKSSLAQWQSWWRNARGFDRQWTWACLAAFAAAVIAWLAYATQKPALIHYLQAVGFDDKDLAGQIAAFSISQAGWFLLIFAAAILLCLLVIAGVFAGKRARLGGVLLGALLVADLGRADLPYIIHWDYIQKYDVDPANPATSTNPIINFLRDKPYEHRVALLHSETPLEQLYQIEWNQHHFPYYNIQSLDIVQQPRVATDIAEYDSTLMPRGTPDSAYLMARHWQLTNTRYLLGPAGYLDSINQQLDPAQKRFRIVERFDIAPKPGVEQVTEYEQLTAVLNDNGSYAVFEFTGALPRAKLYSDWQVNTNDNAVLQTLASTNFDPWQSVLVSTPLPAPAAATNANSGTVEYTSYAPTDIKLHTQAANPTVLLLNDRYDPNWHVTVDGKPAPLFRANFIMRGVYLPAGEHSVEFRFRLPLRLFYVTLSAIGVGILLCGFVLVTERRLKKETTGGNGKSVNRPSRDFPGKRK